MPRVAFEDDLGPERQVLRAEEGQQARSGDAQTDADLAARNRRQRSGRFF